MSEFFEDFIVTRLCELNGTAHDCPAFDGMSWGEIYDRAAALAYALRGYPPGDAPVAVFAPRSPYAAAAMFGVIAAGGWYIPVDPELPTERRSLLLGICRPAVTVGIGAGTGTGVSPAPESDIPFLDISALPSAPEFSPVPRDPDAPMFGIFTSGSTGVPKLVLKSRRAMSTFITVFCRTFGFDGNEVFGNQIPFYFDASTKDIFSTLYLGARTVIIPQTCFSMPVNLVKELNDNRVTTVTWVPSALAIAAKFNVFSAALPEYLKNVLFVGEQMPVKYLNIWRSALPGTRFVNLYGSTEVAGNSCYYTVDREFSASDILPVGRAFDGTRVFIIDPASGLEAPEGEFVIAGPGLASGYYGEPEKTAAVFRDISLPSYSGRAYFSGDFGRVNENGEFVCVSRRDAQIKHMGHRIELGEIEAAASSLDFVGEAVCLYCRSEEKIVLVCSSDADRKRELRSALAGLLPKYMIPHKYIFLTALPHNRNGKLDRAALRAQYAD